MTNKYRWLVVLVSFLWGNGAWAQSGIEYQLYVLLSEPGTLEQMVNDIDETAKFNTESMKVMGPVDGKDMMFIREMCGVKDIDTPTEGKLRFLDLSDVSIMDSPDVYISLLGQDFTTHRGVFGTAFLYNCQQLEFVELPYDIYEIDTLALANCKNLFSINIPPTVESIGYGAFAGCKTIDRIDVPNSVESLGVGCFQQMDALKELFIGHGVMEIDNSLILHDDSLEFISLGTSFQKFDPVVFYTAPSLRSITIVGSNPYFTSDDGVLFSSSMDTLVTFPVASEKVDYVIPDSVSHIAPYAFCQAKALKSVVMPEGLREIGMMAFCGCSALAEVRLNEGLKQISFGAFGMPFDSMSSLKSLSIPASVDSIAPGAFLFNSALEKISFDAGNTSYQSDEQGLVMDNSGQTLCFVPCMTEKVDIPMSVKTIGAYAFAGARQMPLVYLGDQVREVGDMAFAHAIGTYQITLGKGIKVLGDRLIDGCIGLRSLYLFADELEEGMLNEDAFYDSSGNVAELCTLYVLPGKRGNFMTKKGFFSASNGNQFFAEIKEMTEVDGISSKMVSSDGLMHVYGLDGKQVGQKAHGVKIVRMPDGQSVKWLEK